MASIRDVAKEAGVASCTVSRVLNGTANIALETQRKTEEAHVLPPRISAI